MTSPRNHDEEKPASEGDPGAQAGTTDLYVMTAKQAAARYGIHEKTVSDIRRRRSWGHVA